MIRYVFNPFTGTFDAVMDRVPVLIEELDSSAVEEGYFCCMANTNIVHRTDAGDAQRILCVGVSYGDPRYVQTGGSILRARFSEASPVPTLFKPVFLARADEELLGGAAGKLTAQAPSTGAVAEVGLVLAVPPDFVTSRRAKVLLQVKKVLKRS